MSIDRMIRKNLLSRPEDWRWDGERFLRHKDGTILVRRLTDNRWAFVVPNIGQIKLSMLTYVGIEMARKLRNRN